MPWTPEQKREARRRKAEAEGKRPPGRPRSPEKGCGTVTGYYRHKRAGEDACAECKAAAAAYQRERWRRSKNLEENA